MESPSQPSFSVIVPNLHTPSVGQTVRALEQQDYDHSQFEVIVVGMDKFGLVQESGMVHFNRSERPLSSAQARNRGARQARGEVLAFTDADCLPHPDWLAALAERFTDPEVTVVGGGVAFDRHNYWTFADNLSMFYDYLAEHPPGVRRQLPSLNLAIRREVFEAVGGFDERYPRPSGEDADLTIRLRKRGHRLYFEPRAVVTHHPPRNRLADLLRHGYYQGMYSTKVDARYAAEEGLPGVARTRPGLVLFAPLLAAAVTLRMFSAYPNLRQYWYASPAIYLAKLAWCLGAANHPAWN
jgi:cellulose synthase/poly-beta-1,6-N-acetylglucosamine synthase-like glycosyltransferase